MGPEIQGYRFGPYHIDAGERLLHRGPELISLPPKALDTLVVLLGSAGRMVDKNDLMKAIWPDTFVEEGALTRNISLLRKALEDSGDEPHYIETIPKRGYRFIAPVQTGSLSSKGTETAAPFRQPEAEKSWTSSWAAPIALLVICSAVGLTMYLRRDRVETPAAAVKTPSRTVAVLRFRNVEADPAEEYFADGVTQALITPLKRLGKLRVVDLTSESGGGMASDAVNRLVRDQEITHFLTGTVQQSKGRVRIHAELMDPKTRDVSWANSYERDMKDVLALEAAAAEEIANEIQVAITDEERRHLQQNHQINPEAWLAYQRGRYFWNRRTEESLNRALQFFQEAIELDPTFALPYTGQADSYSLLGSIGIDGMRPDKSMPLAKAAAEKALQMDPNLAEAHVSLAYVKLSYDWDLDGAQKEFARAIALDPSSAKAHHWYSHYFMGANDLAKATEQMQLAMRLEPLSPIINLGIGWCYYYSRQYDKAIEQYRSVTEMDPSLPMAHQTLGMAYQQKGLFPQAVAEFQRANALSGNSPTSVAALASAYGAAGQVTEARRGLAQLQELSRTRYVPALYFAMVHNALGETVTALKFGWTAASERSDYLVYLRLEPQVGKLAGDTRFLSLVGSLHR
jgi:DNA-binding winged helix-turn-helix (wHTH) protein/TolB-like protein/Tfp pilus assembly protein PilF